ncbi:hypothetical protein [Nonomuraea insulae]|uniref:Uncharacterized protein n=1 Tax=Nonomuraea insulae TaxID=1616787 RepID=A0ABW1DCK8_9ACTN
MRRYRLGRIAAPLAICYAIVIIASGAYALGTGDPALLRTIVDGEWDPDWMPYVWWVELLMVAGGLLQGWAYWQVLRGRPSGEPVRRGRQVGLLRLALYLSVGCALLFRIPIPYQWWLGVPGAVVQFAVVWLFVAVLAGVLPRWVRILALVAGLANAAMGLVTTVGYGFAAFTFVEFLWSLPGLELLHLVWLVPVLVGQARDPRWSRATVGMGVVSASLSSLSSGGSSIIAFGGGGVDYTMLLLMILGVLGVFGMVWEARSAHELAGPPRVPAPKPAPAPARPWPLAGLAVALPLVPAAVNLAHGMPMWTGPRGAVEGFFREFAGYQASLLWLAVDTLVGVGAPAVLVLVAVVRRTRRLLRGTMLALTLAAAAGVVTALTVRKQENWQSASEMADQELGVYPRGLFPRDGEGQFLFGLSPLWYSAALAASALLLFFLYGAAPAARLRHQVLVTALATSVALCFLPVADQSRGPVTTAADCSPEESWMVPEKPEPVTGPRAFVCGVRENELLTFADTTPDQVLLAHGRRLCGVYTRDDPRELARSQEKVSNLEGALAPICPAADAAVKAANAEDDREFDEYMAEEQRKCDATPRHRPLVPAARAIRVKEPEWPEVGLELYEEVEGADPADDGVLEKSFDNGLVGVGPGHLFVGTHSDYHICVELETYKRRPPVETKGWEHVVEVGFDSPSGRLVFMDGLSGTELPDLSLYGRKGHYRLRVHFDWFPWKGEEYGTQRFLIMAWPAKGDKVVTYKKPPKAR